MYLTLKFLAIGLILSNINVNAQNARPIDLRNNLKLLKEIDLKNDESYQIKFTIRNQLFIISRNPRTKEWSRQKGEVKNLFSPCGNNNYTGGTLDSEGNRFSIGCEDFSVEVWDTATGNKLARFGVRKAETSKNYLIPYMSPDGEKVVVELGERAELWNVAPTKKIADLDSTFCNCNRSVYSVEFSPDSKVVAIAFGGRVFLWNAVNGELLNRLIDKDPDFWGYDESDQITSVGTVRQMLFSRDSKTIITGSGIGVASLWNAETGELLRKFKKHKLAVTALAMSPDGKILATGSRNQDVKLWDMMTGKQLFSLNNRKEVRRLSFHPDGTKLLSMTSTHAFIWETATGKLLEEMPIPDVLTTLFSADLRYVIMPDKRSKTMRLYEYLGR